MDNQIEQADFEQLLSRFSEGCLEPSERKRLGLLIESDQARRQLYLEYCQIHAILRSEHGLLAAWSPPTSQADGELQNIFCESWRWRRQVVYLAAAAVFLIVAASVSFLVVNRDRRPFRGPEMAVLSKAVGAQFAYGVNDKSAPVVGMKLRQGVYELRNGLVEFEYPSGAVLVARAPVTFDLVDSCCIRLENGQIVAHVPKSATGFRVEAPAATVIDLGTDFAVEAVKDQESEVHVFHGEVLVDLHGEKGKSADLLRLVTGEATRVDFSTGMPSGIDLDEQRFVRSLREETNSYAQAVLRLKPAVYYRMEPSGDGAQLLDASGSGANATINVGRASAPVWTAGKVGTALRLGGPAQQTYASVERYPQATGDKLSVVAWVYARSRPRWASIAKNWAGGPEDRGQFHFGLYEDGGELEAHIVDNSGAEISVRDKVPMPLNTWHHVAFVADGGVLRLYRNGIEVDSKPYQKLHRDPRIRSLAIGTKLNLLGTAPEERNFNMWDGNLDELAIFNNALSAKDILMLFELANANN
jgi:ferric-dicitrate binding protein FerR (iron transport regulator)